MSEKYPDTELDDAVGASIDEMQKEIENLKAILKEVDRRTVFEAFGMGNTFSDSIECYLQHGGRCPTVEEAYAGTLLCELHQ